MDEFTKRIDEVKEMIAKAINESQLPVGVIEMILTEYLNQIQIIKMSNNNVTEGESESE